LALKTSQLNIYFDHQVPTFIYENKKDESLFKWACEALPVLRETKSEDTLERESMRIRGDKRSSHETLNQSAWVLIILYPLETPNGCVSPAAVRPYPFNFNYTDKIKKIYNKII